MITLLVAGATGLVGGRAMALALRDVRVDRVVAPTRRPLATHAKLCNPVVDFDRPLDDAQWWRVDAAISALGTTRAAAGSAQAFRRVDLDLVLGIARRVREHGATRFGLVSSMGADAGSRFLYTRTKGEVEEALRRLDFPSLVILRPGLLGGDRDGARPIERAAGVLFRVAAPILPRAWHISPADVVARVLVEAAIVGRPGEEIIAADRLAGAVSGRGG